jgi:hypothetical protein
MSPRRRAWRNPVVGGGVMVGSILALNLAMMVTRIRDWTRR